MHLEQPMALKKTFADQGMKILSDPRVLKLMQDERWTKVMMAALSIPGRLQSFSDEQKEAFAKAMGFASQDEVNDLRRTVRSLEERLASLQKHSREDGRSIRGGEDRPAKPFV